MKIDVGKLKQDMGQLFSIVVGLHRLMEERGGDIRNLRKEFHENFAKSSHNLEALRSSMRYTVKVLVTAVTNDRELTKKLCVAVELLESEEGQNRRGRQEASINRPPPTQNDLEADQVSVARPRGVAVPRRFFHEASKPPVPAVLLVPLPQCPSLSLCAPARLMPIAAPALPLNPHPVRGGLGSV